VGQIPAVVISRVRNVRDRSNKGDKDSDGCAAVPLFPATGKGNLASAPFYKLPGDPEPYAGSELALGREERVKDFLHMLRCDARPAILDDRLNPHSCRADEVSGRDAENAFVPHRIDGIGDNVREDLEHFTLADGDLLQVIKSGVD
jgi:hypothetical protein